MYHAVHSARYFYPDQLAPDMQTDWQWASRYSTAIPYEGLKDRNCDTDEPGPYGCGDPTIHGWGPSNLGLYSGCLSGVFGAVVEWTSDTRVLCLNLNATDTFGAKSYPSRLVYNAKDVETQVSIRVPDGKYVVWDTIHDRFRTEEVADGTLELRIPADDALVLVMVPKAAAVTSSHGKLFADGVAIDYAYRLPEE